MSAYGRLATFAFTFALAFAGEAAAQRSETLRWQDPANDPGDVLGYRIHWGGVSRDYDHQVDVQIPPASNDVYEAQVTVDDTDVYFAVTAYNSEGESFLSNEICRGPGGASCGGNSPPPDEPPPTGAQAAIVGFTLWDAGSDSVIEPNFASGSTIDTAVHSCVAIEVRANSYLDGNGPGSLRYAFDGQSPPACDNPGTSHENSSPFAWEEDAGPGKFLCAPSLTVPGPHSLEVTPFDGDDCTGVMGQAVSIEFDVTDSSNGGGGSDLGIPGRPYIVQ